MRKFLITLALASVAMPAMASTAPNDDGDRRHGGFNRNSEDSRPQRAERTRPARSEGQSESRRDNSNWGQSVVRERSQRSDNVRVEQRQAPSRDTSRSRDFGEWRQRIRERQQQTPTTATPVIVRRDGDRDWRRDGDRTRDRVTERRRDSSRQWTRHWRDDNRYDWRRYRDRNRSIFRVGNYYDPYGYNYRRFSIGFSLWPSYYGSSFWLDDPWMYRLPPAYGPYRWVRYYDDALLVNIYSGQVVDVIYSFFW